MSDTPEIVPEVPSEVEPVDNDDSAILKPRHPRAKRDFTPEQRAVMADRMRAVNAERIAKARARVEQESLAKKSKKQQAIDERLAKEEALLKAEVDALPVKKLRKKATPPPKEKKPRKSVKIITVESSSDSDDSSESDDESIPDAKYIILNKKRLTKDKPDKTPAPPPTPVAPPVPVRPACKFL
jgi:hypothetical protein